MTMGGRKKPTLSQLEKRMRKMREEKEKKERERKYEMKLDSRGVLTQASVDQMVGEITKMPYITPYVVATKFGLKISRAKRILKRLAEEGVLAVYDYNRRVPIYVPAAKAGQKGSS